MALTPSPAEALGATGPQLRVIALAGGVGGAKLAHGLAQILHPENLTIVVNTGDDFEHLGLLICPDIDTVLYNLAEVNHPHQGWGRGDESFNVLEAAAQLGHDPWFRLGDKDIALHLLRSHFLKQGWTLSEATAELGRRLGLDHPVLPMSDDPVRTIIHTPDGDLAFQEYFVRQRCQPVMTGMTLAGLTSAAPTPAFTHALATGDLVILCPSNPYVSIDPILSLPGVRGAIAALPTLAVSPIIGGRALKGPAAKMLLERGVPVNTASVARHYADILDGYVLDTVDGHLVAEIQAMRMRTLVTDTVMGDTEQRQRLAAEVLAFARTLVVETA